MKAIIYKYGDIEATFFVEINAAKTEREFCDHEAHLGIPEKNLREAYGLIREAAGLPKKQIAQVKPAEQTD